MISRPRPSLHGSRTSPRPRNKAGKVRTTLPAFSSIRPRSPLSAVLTLSGNQDAPYRIRVLKYPDFGLILKGSLDIANRGLVLNQLGIQCRNCLRR